MGKEIVDCSAWGDGMRKGRWARWDYPSSKYRCGKRRAWLSSKLCSPTCITVPYVPKQGTARYAGRTAR